MIARRYAEWEDALILEHYHRWGTGPLSLLLDDRTPAAIKTRAAAIGAQRRGYPDWSLKEEAVLRRFYPDLSRAALLLPDRTMIAIRGRCQHLGMIKQAIVSRKYWKEAEDDLIRKLAPTHTDAKLAAILGRGVAAVTVRRGRIGVWKRPTQGKPVPLIADLLRELGRKGTTLAATTIALNCPRIFKGATWSQIEPASAVVAALGGELYAEWDD